MINKRDHIYNGLEHIVSLVEIQVSNNKLEDVSKMINYLVEVYSRFLLLWEKDKVLFARILYHPNFYEINVPENDPKNIIDPFEVAGIWYREKDTLQFQEKFTNILFRITTISNLSISDNISESVINACIRIIKDLEMKKFHTNSILSFMNLISSIGYNAISNNSKGRIKYLGSYGWYINIVFHNRIDIIKYHEFLTYHLINTFKPLIDYDEELLFKSFVNSCTDDISITVSGIDNIPHSLRQSLILNGSDEVYMKLSNLSFETYSISTVVALKEWRLSYEKLRNRIEENFEVDENLNRVLDETYEKADSFFRYNDLRLTVSSLFTYLIFKKKYGLINILLTTNQPLDSGAIQTNRDINPLRLDDILELFKEQSKIRNRIFSIWEGHHGFETYFVQYIVILIASMLRYVSRTGQVKPKQDFMAIIKPLNLLELDVVKYNVEKINNIVLANVDFVTKSGITTDFVNAQVTPFTEFMVKSIEAQIKKRKIDVKIDKESVSVFIENVQVSIKKNRSIRNIITFYRPQIIQDFMRAKPSMLAYGVNEISPVKGMFIPEDPVIYFDSENSYANRLIFTDDNVLSSQFSSVAEKTNSPSYSAFKDEFDRKIDRNLLLISRNVHLEFDVFDRDRSFVPSYELNDIEKAPGFAGIYKGIIDTYQFFDQSPFKDILIFDKRSLKKMTNFKLGKKDGDHYYDQNLFFKVTALQENKELIRSYLKEAPEWLQIKGSKEIQEEFLLSCIKFEMYYKTKLEFDKNPVVHQYIFDI